MANAASWVSLGEVDRGKDVAEGVIELSQSKAEAAGAHDVLLVRCHSDSSSEPAPDLQLKVTIGSVRFPVVSNATYGGLRVADFGPAIEVQKLTVLEMMGRIASRVMLPTLVLIAASAAVVALLVPDLKETLGIVTAALAVPAAVVALVKAIREP